MRRLTAVLVGASVWLASLPAAAEEQPRDWAVTLYTTWLSEDALGDMLVFNAELESGYRLWALALSKRFASLNEHLDLEIEGQVAKHTVGQDHWEFNGLGVARWRTFPWDRHLDTSLAVGLGVSYATETPPFEVERKGTSGNTMAYILVELAFGLPSMPQWEVVARIHHRSAAYGLFNSGQKGASNAFGFGLKYRF